MSTLAALLECFNRKPDDFDLASVDFPGISSERLAESDADIWTLNRSSMFRIDDGAVYLAGVHLGDIKDFKVVADDPRYRQMTEYAADAAKEMETDPQDFDLIQKYFDARDNCNFLVLNALEMARLKKDRSGLSESLRQFKLGYMAVLQRLPDNLYEELSDHFSRETEKLKEQLDTSQLDELLLEQLEFFVENRQYDLTTGLVDELETLSHSLDAVSMSKFRYLEGNILFSRNCGDAEDRYKSALEYIAVSDSSAENRLRAFHSLSRLGMICNRTGRFEEAEAYLYEALPYLDEVPEEQYVYFTAERAGVFNYLGYLYDGAEDYARAEECYVRALQIRQKIRTYSVNVEGHYATTLGNLAFVYDSTGRFEESDRAFEDTVAIQKKLAYSNPREHLVQYAKSLYNYVYTVRNRYLEESDDKYSGLGSLCDEAIGLFRRISAEAGPAEWREKLAWLLFDRGISYYTCEDEFAKAESFMKESLSIRESFIPDDKDWMEPCSNVCFRLGDMYILKEEYEKAKDCFLRALQYRRQGSSDILSINAMRMAASSCVFIGQYDEALDLCLSALKLSYSLEDEIERQCQVALSKTDIGKVYFCMNEYLLSRISYSEAMEICISLEQATGNEFYTETIAICRDWIDDIDQKLSSFTPATFS